MCGQMKAAVLWLIVGALSTVAALVNNVVHPGGSPSPVHSLKRDRQIPSEVRTWFS